MEPWARGAKSTKFAVHKAASIQEPSPEKSFNSRVAYESDNETGSGTIET